MTGPANARPSGVAPRTAPRAAHAVEQLLDVLGAESALAEDVIGDLAEEHALRRERDGAASAHWWYAREAACAVPHLLWSALRHGRPAARARLLALLGGAAFGSLAVVVAIRAMEGPPARLVPGHEGTPDRVVVSTLEPVKIPLRVFDARGHQLPDSAVRFAWVSGAAARVSPDGVAQCTGSGGTIARATLGDLATRVRIDCQPVAALRMKYWYNMRLGDDTQELRVGGYGYDGRPVTRIAAVASVDDPRIVKLEGRRVKPLAPGRTFVTVSTGERWVRAAITVFEPVRTLEGLRADQRFVMAPVRIAPGQSIRWPLPLGWVWLVNQVDQRGDAPAMTVSGAARCDPVPAPGPGMYRTHCQVEARGATVTLSWPSDARAAIETVLAVERP
jgi:hypothetical protein